MAGLPAAKTFYADHMGLIHDTVQLSNLSRPRAAHLCIHEHIAIQLQLRELEQREVILADGHRRTVPYMGPIEVRFANRRCFTGAMVLGNEVLLGPSPWKTWISSCGPSCSRSL